MFAPPGYTNFEVIYSRLMEHVDYFVDVHVAPHFLDVGFDMPKIRVVSARYYKIYLNWLLDHLFFVQPAPVYLASPEGRLVKVTSMAFSTGEHPVWHDFCFPPKENDHWFKFADPGESWELLNESYDLTFVDTDTWTINCLTDEEMEKKLLFNHPAIKRIRALLRSFDGWSICVQDTDWQTISDYLVEVQFDDGDDDKKQEILGQACAPGRPRTKRDSVITAILEAYPSGHEGVPLKDIMNHLIGSHGIDASRDTFIRAIEDATVVRLGKQNTQQKVTQN